MTGQIGCLPGCRCRCGQQGCGCHVKVGTTPAACAYDSAGIRCSLCNGPARAQRVESQIQGKQVGLLWCPVCDVPSDPRDVKPSRTYPGG